MTIKTTDFREALRVLVLQYLWRENHPQRVSVTLSTPDHPLHEIVNIEWALKLLGADPNLKPTYPPQTRVWLRHAWKAGDLESPFQSDLTLWEGWVKKERIPTLFAHKFSWWHRSDAKYPDAVWEQELEDAYETWMKAIL